MVGSSVTRLFCWKLLAVALPGGLRYYGFKWQHLKGCFKLISDVGQKKEEKKRKKRGM